MSIVAIDEGAFRCKWLGRAWSCPGCGLAVCGVRGQRRDAIRTEAGALAKNPWVRLGLVKIPLTPIFSHAIPDVPVRTGHGMQGVALDLHVEGSDTGVRSCNASSDLLLPEFLGRYDAR